MSAMVTLEPWDSGDLPLLERLMGDPSMTEHLGGPESPDKLRERQDRYEPLTNGDRMFKIVDVASVVGVGSAGYWTKPWRDEQVYEIGWMVMPEFQGRGVALTATVQAIEFARRDGKHRIVHAFQRWTTRRRTRCAASLASNWWKRASLSSRRGTS